MLDGEAQIPDDWTSGYKNYSVMWPDSVDWMAILRGLLQSPIDAIFWNSDSGTVSDGQAPIVATLDNNLHLEECTMIPSGFCGWFAGSAPPAGWLVRDGSLVSRSTYANLFAAIGVTWGVGDGSTTFGLPNAKGRSEVGLDDSQPDFDTVGEVGGTKDVNLSAAENGQHTHIGTSHTHPGISHAHTSVPHTHTTVVHNHNRNVDGQGETIFDDTVGSGAFGAAAGSRATLTYGVTGNATPAVNGGSAVIAGAVAGVSSFQHVNQDSGIGEAHNNMHPYGIYLPVIKI